MRGIFPNFKGSGHWEASMVDAPSLLHPARLAAPGSLSRVGYSTTGSLPHRTLSGDLAFSIHTVFLKSLKSLGSEEQIAKWAPLCNDFQIIATYAQTELGHGEPGLLPAVFRWCTVPERQRLYISMQMFQQVAVKGLEGGGSFI